MPKDSQLDPKEVRKRKARGGPTMAQSELDGEGRNTKKQSGNRHKPGDDKVGCLFRQAAFSRFSNYMAVKVTRDALFLVSRLDKDRICDRIIHIRLSI